MPTFIRGCLIADHGVTDQGVTDRGVTDRGFTDRGVRDRGSFLPEVVTDRDYFGVQISEKCFSILCKKYLFYTMSLDSHFHNFFRFSEDVSNLVRFS